MSLLTAHLFQLHLGFLFDRPFAVATLQENCFCTVFAIFIKTLKFDSSKSFVRELVKKMEYHRYAKTN